MFVILKNIMFVKESSRTKIKEVTIVFKVEIVIKMYAL